MQRIYVRAPNWVGDTVMATAAFARIRRGFPGASIVCGVRPWLRPLLSGNPWFDGYLDTPRAGAFGFARLRRQVLAVRKGSFDLAVVLPNSFETGLVPFLAGVPRRLGYKQGRRWLINLGKKAKRQRSLLGRHGPRRRPQPMPDYYDELLDVIGLPAGPTRPELQVSSEERGWIDCWLREHDVAPDAPLVLLSAGASFGASKLWVPERFAALADRFRERGLAPILLSGPAEVDMVDDIAALCGAVAATDPVIPLDKLKALVLRARMMVSTDTGPRHVAVALGVPVVTIMGPTDRRYTDYALQQQVVIQKDLPCVPCHRKVCPLGHHDCMKKIEVDEVLAASDALAE